MAGYKPRTILVTGGAGFIGCNFVRYMLQTDANIRIVNLDALTYAGTLDYLQDLPDSLRHTFVHGSICNRALIDQLLHEYCIDTVVNFAAESHVDNSIVEPDVFVKTNVLGTFALLEAVRQFWHGEQAWSHDKCRFHHISTDEVYGSLEADDAPFSETTPFAPTSPYSASKAGADHLVRAWFHTYGLPVTTTNCSNNYGPYQHAEKFIPTVIRSCLDGRPIPIYGDGTNIRDWLYVGDHCSAIDAVIRKGRLGETYNVGGINEWRNIDICRLICNLMDEYVPENAPHDRLISFVSDRPGHDWRYAINASRISEELGWRPIETFETGIRKTVAWNIDVSRNALR